jgi:hypothetical protein
VKILVFGRYALGVFALAACSNGGTQLPVLASHSSGVTAPARSQFPNDLFVASVGPAHFAPTGRVDVFGLAHGRYFNDIRDVDKPAAIVVDSKGTVYVANTAPHESDYNIGTI